MKSDIVPILSAVIDERLCEVEIEWSTNAAVCVVLASRGYPGDYKKGFEIKGLDEVDGMKDVITFHAGTALQDGKLVTDGGRVLGVTALGGTIPQAIDRVYEAVQKISWYGFYYRKDIGRKALKYL